VTAVCDQVETLPDDTLHAEDVHQVPNLPADLKVVDRPRKQIRLLARFLDRIRVQEDQGRGMASPVIKVEKELVLPTIAEEVASSNSGGEVEESPRGSPMF